MTFMYGAHCWEGGGVGEPGLCSKPALSSQGSSDHPMPWGPVLANSVYPSERRGAAPRMAPAAPESSASQGGHAVVAGSARPRDGEHKGCCYLHLIL